MRSNKDSTYWAAMLSIELHEACTNARKLENRTKSNLIETALYEYIKKNSIKNTAEAVPKCG